MEIIGIMSGTSLDGCDIAHKFTNKNGITRSSIPMALLILTNQLF